MDGDTYLPQHFYVSIFFFVSINVCKYNDDQVIDLYVLNKDLHYPGVTISFLVKAFYNFQ